MRKHRDSLGLPSQGIAPARRASSLGFSREGSHVNRTVSWIFGTLIVLFIVVVPYQYYRYRYNTLKRLRVVDEGKLCRSGCLTVDGFETAIKEYGIKTIINLMEEAQDPALPKSCWSRQTERESELCKRLGVRYEFVFVDTVAYDKEATQKPAAIAKFFKIMDDPTAWPVLIHCKAGLHRTGVMTALYRMEYNGWSTYEAIEEMRQNGFSRNPSYSPNDYVRQYLANYVPRSKWRVDLTGFLKPDLRMGGYSTAGFGKRLDDESTFEGALNEQQAAFAGNVATANTQTDRVKAIGMRPATGAVATEKSDTPELTTSRRLAIGDLWTPVKFSTALK